MTKMNPEVKAKWLEALRSGHYNQGTCYLMKENTTTHDTYYCCLGVLCDIKEPNQWHVAEELGYVTDVTMDTIYRHASEDGNAAFPPQEVLDWAGLPKDSVLINKENTGFIKYKNNRFSFPELNDLLHLSFKEIADLIEEQL